MDFQPGAEIAKHLRAVYFGGNWTSVNYRDSLQDLTWNQANQRISSFHTIAELVYHTSYYIHAVTRVFKGGALDASDKFSFDLPPVQSELEWNTLVQNTWTAVEELASLIDKLEPEKWTGSFVDEKYGSYYRNMHGIIEHSHYHLGQIILLKKMILSEHPPLHNNPDT